MHSLCQSEPLCYNLRPQLTSVGWAALLVLSTTTSENSLQGADWFCSQLEQSVVHSELAPLLLGHGEARTVGEAHSRAGRFSSWQLWSTEREAQGASCRLFPACPHLLCIFCPVFICSGNAIPEHSQRWAWLTPTLAHFTNKWRHFVHRSKCPWT